ncbi:unnamed protein product [Discula destructiva]
MGLRHTIAATAIGLMAQQSLAANLDPITSKGQYLFYSGNGTQFFMKGVAYQQGIAPGGASESTTIATFIDSLADTASCTRDIPLLQELGTNLIRVYAIDPTADHTTCMNALANAGIYVIADLSVPGESINRDTPAWTTDLYARYTGVIDNLGPFTNTLGFFAGNEVTNNKSNSNSAAFVKAAVRDSKAYITSKNFGRWLGVGYATNDDADTRDLLANYFNCGEDQSAAVDFWGYNIYEWCGQSTFQESGYQERTEAFANYSVPAFFSEYGCNNPGGANGRLFQDTPVLYSPLMNKVWSGGIVYEYFQEQNDYGLVELSGSKVTKMENFQTLADAVASVDANSSDASTISMSSYTPTNSPRACPSVAAGAWLASDVLPPTPNTTLCENMVASSSCVPAANLDANATAALFGTVCGLSDSACDGISGNATTGKYGEFVMCNATEQLANALNAYYVSQKKASTACDFDGQAQVVTPTETLLPSANGGSGSSGGSSSSGSKSAAPRTTTSMLGSAGWAGSLLMAVGAGVVLTL